MKHGFLWTVGAVAAVAAVGVLLVPTGAQAQCCPGGVKTPVAVKAWTADAAKPAAPAKGGAKKAHARAVTDLAAALKAIDKALAAVEAGDRKAATSQLQAARKLIDAQHIAAVQRAAPAKLAYVNARCPMMGSAIKPEKVTPKLLRTHKGQKVAFCCAGCLAPWDKLSAKAKATKLAAAGTKKTLVGPKAATGVYANTRCPIMGGRVKPGKGGSAVYNGKKVGFCCPGCIPAWNRLTDKEKAAKLAKSK